MINISVDVKEGSSFVPINGIVVYPYTFSNPLDERLDEGYITVINSTVEKFPPMTELKITLDDGITTKTQSMVIANDTPKKNILSGRYNHNIYVVERTKILSGFVCPSLTFTNDLYKKYQPIFSIEGSNINWSPAGYSSPLPNNIVGQVSLIQSRLPRFNSSGKLYAYDNLSNSYRYLNYGVCLPYNSTYISSVTSSPDICRAKFTTDDPNTTEEDRNLYPKFVSVEGMPRFYSLANIVNEFNQAKTQTSDGTFKGHYIHLDWCYIVVKINGSLYAILTDPYNPAETDVNGNDFPIQTIDDISTEDYVAPFRFSSLDQNEDTIDPPFDYMGNYEIKANENGATVIFTNADYRTPVFTVPANLVNDGDVVTFDYYLPYTTNSTIGEKNSDNKYTFTLSVAVFKNNVARKDYTIADCVDRILTLAEPLKAHGTPRFSLNSQQRDKLKAKKSAEFSMTQNTLREQLKVVGSYIHAEPRLNSDDTIHFDDYAPGKTTTVNGKLIEKTLTWDVNNYCSELRSNAQNLVSASGYGQGKAYQQGIGISRSLHPETTYARLTDNNGVAETQFAIYGIEKVLCGVDLGPGAKKHDITAYVYEATQYNILSGWSGAYPFSKGYAIYYELGQKNLKGITYAAKEFTSTEQALSQRFAIVNILSVVTQLDENQTQTLQTYVSQNPNSVEFEIVYRPIYPTLVSHGKNGYNPDLPQYTKVYNQSENFIESNAFGENIKGAAARMGNPDIKVTFLLPTLADIPKPGYIYDGLVISTVETEISPNSIKCTLGLTKDFNRISQYISVSSVKRMYNVSERQVSNRDILLKNSIVISDSLNEITSDANNPIVSTDSSFWDALKSVFFVSDWTTQRGDPISCVIAQGVTEGSDSSRSYLRPVLLPVIPTAFGNTMSFYFAYEDNYSAGTALNRAQLSTSTLGGWWSNAVQYGDNDGRIELLEYYLISNTGDIKAWATPQSLPGLTTEYNYVPQNAPAVSCAYVAGDEAMRLLKDGRERISVTTVFEFVSNIEGLVIGSALSSLNPLVSTTLRDNNIGEAILWAITDINAIPSIYETKLDTIEGLSNMGSLFVNTNDGFVVNSLATAEDDVYGWVITTPSDKEIKEYRDLWNNVTEYLEEERGYQILLSYTKPISQGNRLLPAGGLHFTMINE